MAITTDNETILRSVLDEWKAAVDSHDPQRVAAIFTNDAIFQGLHPYTVGPQGVADYYAAQPLGMTATYRILETRRLADDLILGYLSVDFTFTDRPTVSVYLSVVIQPALDGAKISHYQVYAPRLMQRQTRCCWAAGSRSPDFGQFESNLPAQPP